MPENKLRAAFETFKGAALRKELVAAASEFAKTALSGKDKAKRTLIYIMESKPASTEIVLTDLIATNPHFRGINFGKIEQAAKELEKEGRIKFDGVVMQSIPGAGQKIAIDLLKKVQAKFKSKHKHLSTDLDLHDDPDQATLNVWDDNDEPTYAGILNIVVDYMDGAIGIIMIYPGSMREVTLAGGNADRVFKEAEQFVKKVAPEFFTKAKEEE